MGDKTYEMLWDCKYCSTRKLLGKSQRCCPLCGAPQDVASRYFPSDAEKIAVEDHTFVGADVQCPACREANSKNAKHCTNCGSPLDAAAAVALRAEQVVGDADAPRGEPSQRENALPVSMASAGHLRGRATPRKSRARVAALAAGLALSALALLTVFFSWKREATFEVTRSEWARNLEIERYGLVQREAFCDEMPSAARAVTRSQKQRGSEQIPNGEDCQTRKIDRGDGTYSEKRECTPRYTSRPIMAEYCRFSVMDWSVTRTEKALGTHGDAPRWPDAHLARTGQCDGCEREGKRRERFLVSIKSQTADSDECEVAEAAWRRMVPGAKLKGQTRALTGGVICDSLEP